jgi:iron complex outermembrane receptor protein
MRARVFIKRTNHSLCVVTDLLWVRSVLQCIMKGISMRKFSLLIGTTLMASGAAFAPASAMAQDATASAAAPESGDIVVTARRREESIINVPISISAFSSATIAQHGLNSVSAVAQQTPGLQFDRGATAGDIRPSLRGIALIEGRSNVAIIVDGIDVTGVSLNTTIGGGGSQTSTTLMDLERIEVVKGPQTVYFGRSAFAGAIQFVSKEPSFTPGGSFQGSLGNYGRREITANVTGPIVGDTVAAKLSATYRNFDGFYKNPTALASAAAKSGAWAVRSSSSRAISAASSRLTTCTSIPGLSVVMSYRAPTPRRPG